MPLHRYYLNTTPLWPTPTSFSSTLSLLPSTLHKKPTSYHFPTDRSLSLASSLLQRWLFTQPLPLNPHPYPRIYDVPILPDPDSGRPRFAGEPPERTAIVDYNTSHHNPRESPAGAGGEVAIVGIAARTATGAGRVGVDVVPTLCRGDPESHLACFDDDAAGVFTARERGAIRSAGTLEEQVRLLYLLWGLKEAYTKAVGTGIVGNLLDVEFRGVVIFDKVVGGPRRRKWTVMDGLRIWVGGKDVTEDWWIEITTLEGVAEGFYLMVCADREGLDLDVERDAEWKELDFERDVRPFGGS